MNSPLDRLRNVKQAANEADETRELYSRFVSTMREQGWTDEDVQEYADGVRVLMGKDDQAALNLFPADLYSTAEEARQSARTMWRKAA